jgi:pilus assembly protein CpaE
MPSIVEFDSGTAQALATAAGEDSRLLDGLDTLRAELDQDLIQDTVVLGPSIDQQSALELTARYRVTRPLIGFVLVRKRVDSATLADSLRAGVREVVADRDLAEVAAAIRRSVDITRRIVESAAHDGSAPRKTGKVITVFSAKGGCGKTTLSVNTAVSLARGGSSVALVDLDLAFGDVAISLQLEPKRTVIDALSLDSDWDAAGVKALLTKHDSGVMVLAAPDDPSLAEKVDEDTIRGLLQVLTQEFDYVVVDTVPALDNNVLAAFDVSDRVALLTTLDIPSLKNTKITLRTLDLLSYPRDKFRLVLNRADSKVGLDADDVAKSLGMPVSGAIPSSRDVPTLTNRGVAIVAEVPNHAVSRAVGDFTAGLFHKDSKAANGAEKPQKGMFRRRKSA